MSIREKTTNPLIAGLEEEARRQARIEAGTALAPEIYAKMRELFADKFPQEPSEGGRRQKIDFPSTHREGDDLDEEKMAQIEIGLRQMLRDSRLDGASISLVTQREVEGVGVVAIEIVLKKSGETFRLKLSLADQTPESVFVIGRHQLMEESTAHDSEAPSDPMERRMGYKYRTWPRWRRGVDVENARGILAIVEQLSQAETENAWKLLPGDRSSRRLKQ